MNNTPVGKTGDVVAPAAVYEVPDTIRRMLLNTGAFLWSLSADQRARATFAMDDPRRLNWDFVPKPDRNGVPLSELDKHQRTAAHVLLASSLSGRGYTQALQIMAMENILRELEVGRMGVGAGNFRHPDSYYISIYGRPALEDTWGWRFLGHHLSVSFTIIGQRYLAVTPCNMGAQPARSGVLEPLVAEEQLGFELLNLLDADQRAVAVIHDVAPADFTTRQVPDVGAIEYPDHYDLGILYYQITDDDREKLKFVRDEPSGIAASKLDDEQVRVLLALTDSYFGRLPDEVAAKHRDRLERQGLDSLFFSWAGQDRPGTPHYYRIHGHDMLIEFDNAIDSGSHIHSVWRDLDNDLGRGLLVDHYEQERTTGSHLRTRLESSVPYNRGG